MRYKGVTKFIAGLLAAAMVVTGVPVSTLNTADAKTKTEKLSYKGYTKVWEDNFDGNSLNMKDWNVETHEPGWVNAELQEYTESGNIKVSDGKLTIIPKRTKNADGTYSYTSGRINTQNKHDFKYGIMEARMKFPKGQGYLPAFWMMPTNENLYGQWPKCGEIDIAEVMGQDTKKIYGTIHYGEPHAQSQGTEVLKKGNFADDWHTCAVEWEPGSIKWYVDGVLYHEENQWFTKTPGQGEVTYPAPFDQNFYIIFNLAIGGSWVGYPDKTTDYNSNFQVDYVKVYQKKNYNENVKKPEKKVVLKKADKKGNFISNADFSKNEKLDGSANWQFMTAQSGEGSAAIKNKKIEIKTKNAGKEEYSIQLVQPGLPMEKGATYEVSFDAYADKARTMKVDISGPDMNYMRYFNDTAVNLTTKKKSYKFKFTMNEDTDANSRLEFNMGAQGSTANVYITNVKVKKVKSATKAEADKKTVLADGNLVYNGKFQEGDKRLGYWNIKKKNASVAVSNKDYNDRKLVVKLTKDSKAADVKVYQTGLAFEANKEYSVSFAASATTARTIKVKVAGKTFNAKLNKATKNYEFIMKTGKKLTDKNVIFYLGGKKGTVCIDNVVVTENSLIKNGSFNAGTTGWTEWHDTSEADLSFVIDSLSEDNAADFTIKKTGSEDWKIQLKQENVPLEKDQYYKLTFKAKSSKTRKMRAIMQGLEDKGWAVYSGENTVKLTSKYKTYTKVFQMTADSDPKSQISFCLGAVAGKAINTQHRVCIDDVNLEIISEKEAKKYLGEGPKTQDSMIKDGTFVKGMEMWSEWHEAAEADAQYEVVDNAVHFTVNKTGSEDWKIQLKQENIKLEQGHYYKLTFKGKSDLERKVRATVQGGESRNYSHYTGDYFVTLKKDYQTYEHVFKMNEATDDKTSFQICMGAVGGAINKTHNMYFTDFSLVEISEEEGKKLAKNQFAGGVAGGGDPSGNPPTNPEKPQKPASTTSDIADPKSDPSYAVAGNATVEVKAVSTYKKINVPNKGTAVNAEDIKIPVAQVSNVKPDQINKITLNAGKDGMVYGLRRSRILSLEDTVKVQFAIQFGNNEPVLLTDENRNTDVNLTAAKSEVVLYYQDSTNATVGNPKILCYAGALPAGTPILVDVVKVENIKPENAAEIPVGSEILENTQNINSQYTKWNVDSIFSGSGNGTPSFAGDTATINITNVGSADWNVQLKQTGLPMVVGKYYKITYTIESSEARKVDTNLMAVQNIDGADRYGWIIGKKMYLAKDKPATVTLYVKEGLKPTYEAEGKTVTTKKANIGLFFSLGQFGETAASTVKISKVSIKLIDANEVGENSSTGDIEEPSKEETKEPETSFAIGSDLLKDTQISKSKIFNKDTTAAGTVEQIENGVKITITDPSTKGDWAIQLKHAGLALKKGKKYKYSFTIQTNNQDWNYKSLLQPGDAKYDDPGTVGQKEGTATTTAVPVEVEVTPNRDVTSDFTISLGNGDPTKYNISNSLKDGTTSVDVMITNLKMVEIENSNPETPEQPGEPENPEENSPNANPLITLGSGLLANTSCKVFNEGGTATGSAVQIDNGVKITIKDPGTDEWHIQISKSGLNLEKNAQYKYSYTVQTDKQTWKVKSALDGEETFAGTTREEKEVTTSTQTVSKTFTATEYSNKRFSISLGNGQWLKNDLVDSNESVTITIKDLNMEKVYASNAVAMSGNPSNLLYDSQHKPNGVTLGAIGAGYDASFAENCMTIQINQGVCTGNVWDQYLVMYGMKYEAGKKYRLTARVTSSINRTIKAELQDVKTGEYETYITSDDIELIAGQEKEIDYTFEIQEGTQLTTDESYSATFQFKLGAKDSGTKYADAHTIKFSHICLVQL